MQALQRSFATFMNNTYVNAALTLFLILYAGLVRPPLPPMISDLFENPLFRLLFLFLLAWTASKNSQVAILVAVAFVVTMGLLGEQRMVEGFFAGSDDDEE